MRSVVRWLVRLVTVLVAAVLIFLGYVYVRTSRAMAATYQVTVPAVQIPADAAAIERGRYISERVSMCSDCHGKDLGGRIVEESFAMGRMSAPNLTRGKGGIGASYTDADYVRTLMHGVRPDGRSVLIMPSSEYRFSERSLADLIAYLKQVPPVDREMPKPTAGPLARVLAVVAGYHLIPAAIIDHERVSFAAEQTAENAVAYGAQLVAMGGCQACHLPDLTGGGGPPPGAGNITPVGIGDWTERDFVTALRQHTRPNGSAISETMPLAYGDMSDTDLAAIYAYLKTVPAAGKKTERQLP
jgi:cytochrome c553